MVCYPTRLQGMILLIGGTSETAPLAEALAVAGFKVLVSTATQVPLDVGKHPNIASRSGILDGEGMAQLRLTTGVHNCRRIPSLFLSRPCQRKKVALDLSIPYLDAPAAAKMGTPYFCSDSRACGKDSMFLQPACVPYHRLQKHHSVHWSRPYRRAVGG
jgi:hypothetical protein